VKSSLFNEKISYFLTLFIPTTKDGWVFGRVYKLIFDPIKKNDRTGKLGLVLVFNL
jgi:hypothetical protein